MFWKGKLSLDQLWDLMVNIFTENLNTLCPVKKIRIRVNEPSWFDGELRRAITVKNNHLKAMTADCDPTAWAKVRADRKSVRTLIVQKKRNFITTQLYENRNKPKKFWKEIQKNLHFGKDKCTDRQIMLKDANGNLFVGKDAVNPLNSYYVDVGKNLAEKFNTTWKPSQTLVHNLHIPRMNFRFITMKELTAIVKCLNVNKSSNVENINASQLKDALKIMMIEFTYFINECLQKSRMPRKWSVGTISPVPKKGMSHTMADYRPISVLPTLSKVIERAVYNQLVYHLESHGLLDHRQHGFRKDHSTSSAIFEQYLYNSLDSKKYISCVFIDYSKAFDTIDHDILCKKLTFYGLGDGVLAWCKDYLFFTESSV